MKSSGKQNFQINWKDLVYLTENDFFDGWIAIKFPCNSTITATNYQHLYRYTLCTAGRKWPIFHTLQNTLSLWVVDFWVRYSGVIVGQVKSQSENPKLLPVLKISPYYCFVIQWRVPKHWANYWYFNAHASIIWFFTRDSRMLHASLPSSGRLSVRLSHSWSVSKRCKLGSRNLYSGLPQVL